MKKINIAISTCALLIMVTFSNQAKGFTVNSTDLYLVLSTDTTTGNEQYIDLGSISSILASFATTGTTVSFTNSSGDTYWGLAGDTNNS